MLFETWQDVLYYVVPIAIGFLGVPLTQFLKGKLGIDGKYALLLTYVVAGLLAVTQLVLMKQLDIGNITPETLPATFGLVFATATAYYKFLVSKPDPLPLPE